MPRHALIDCKVHKSYTNFTGEGQVFNIKVLGDPIFYTTLTDSIMDSTVIEQSVMIVNNFQLFN